MLKFGILNITPDSFSDGGRFSQKESAFLRFEALLKRGFDFVDIGGASSRPGSLPVTPKEEWSRIGPVLELLSKQQKTHFVSVDTFHPEVIQKSLALGVGYINSIQGCLDPLIMQEISKSGAGFIAMHMHKTPKEMQIDPLDSNEAIQQVEAFFQHSKELILSYGFTEDRYFLDPGIGFGKTFAANESLLRKAKDWSKNYPLFYGISRKKFIREKLGLDFGDELDAVCRGMEYLLEISGVNAVRFH